MNAPTKTDIKTRIGQYVRLRDHIKKLDEEHKNKMKPYRETLEELNAAILAALNEAGGESVRTEFGTAYRTEKKSASLADADAFMRYVIGSEAWDLLDRKANVTAVEDYIKEHGEPPPGVNFSSRYEVGVRRPSATSETK